jgi:D-amino peptidase
MVSGDDKVCAEARRFLGDIEVAVVKEGLQRNMAKMLSPKRSRSLIHQTAKAALQDSGTDKPFVLSAPYEKRIVYCRSEFADGRTCDCERVTRVDATTVIYRSSDLVDILTMG